MKPPTPLDHDSLYSDERHLRRVHNYWFRNLPEHYRELDRRLQPFLTNHHKAEPFPWLRAARHALMLTAETVAQRAGVSRSTFSDAEKSEAEGTITIEVLARYAEAMDCEFIYAIRPKSKITFSEMIWAQLLEEGREHLKKLSEKSEFIATSKTKSRKEITSALVAWSQPSVWRKRGWRQRKPV